MKKLRNKAGLTLIEMLCTLLIMVLLVMAIGVGMDTGTRIYADATFEAESATLAGILNNSLGDILRYSNVRVPDEEEKAEKGIPANVEFLFTSMDYGIQDAYFYTPKDAEGRYMGTLQMKNIRNADVMDLVNEGAYPNLGVTNFVIEYTPRTGTGVDGSYFSITYDICNKQDDSKVRKVETIVRLMND